MSLWKKWNIFVPWLPSDSVKTEFSWPGTCGDIYSTFLFMSKRSSTCSGSILVRWLVTKHLAELKSLSHGQLDAGMQITRRANAAGRGKRSFRSFHHVSRQSSLPTSVKLMYSVISSLLWVFFLRHPVRKHQAPLCRGRTTFVFRSTCSITKTDLS